ncbi:hypothetical protein [Akkermansia phage Moulinsart]|nr:hypothetical protein [Akkermansia phage Moulinsart]
MRSNRYEVRKRAIISNTSGKEIPGWGIYDTQENKFTGNWHAFILRKLADADCRSMNWHDRRKKAL